MKMAPWTCNKMAIQWQRWLQAKSCHNQPQSRKNWLQLKCHSWPYKQRNEKHKTSSKSKRIMIITDTCSKENPPPPGSVQMKRWSWQTAKWRKERERVPKSILSPLEWDCKVFVFILCSSSKKNIKKTFGKTTKKKWYDDAAFPPCGWLGEVGEGTTTSSTATTTCEYVKQIGKKLKWNVQQANEEAKCGAHILWQR